MPLKPTPAELTEWEARLEAEGLGDPDKGIKGGVAIRDTDGVRIPAQPVREGGMFWSERTVINWGDEHRSKGSAVVAPVEGMCPGCGKRFEARKGTKYCDRRCQMKMLMRTKRVSAKLRIPSEEPKQ